MRSRSRHLDLPLVSRAEPAQVGLAPRTLLGIAAAAVGFAAADTYVVVLALPDMMGSVGLNVDELQRAAPIVSGFLLGYIAMLPLMGRIADLRGRVPALVGSLVVFSIGSLVTAASYDLESMVIGRFLQGVGGGGLVPATLALVADIWVVERRGLPLGMVGAVQELGSVVGPLFGALVLAVGTWHTIFWINLAVGAVLAAALVVLAQATPELSARPPPGPPARTLAGTRFDWLGLAACRGLVGRARLGDGGAGLAHQRHHDRAWRSSRTSATVAGRTPMALTCYLAAALFVVRELTARRPLVNLRGLGSLGHSADLAARACSRSALPGSSSRSPRQTQRSRCSPPPDRGCWSAALSSRRCSGCGNDARRLR